MSEKQKYAVHLVLAVPEALTDPADWLWHVVLNDGFDKDETDADCINVCDVTSHDITKNGWPQTPLCPRCGLTLVDGQGEKGVARLSCPPEDGCGWMWP